MSELSAPAASPADIEARQDDLLRQLDALEKRIDRVLADYAATVKSPAQPVMGRLADGISQPVVGTAGMTLPFSPVVSPAAATG